MSTAGNWTQVTTDLFKLLELKGYKSGDLFTTADAYTCADSLQRMHPENTKIKAKIRQQLQVLRDNDIIEFVDNLGNYRFL